MLYSKVVVGLPVEGPFDYIVPEALEKKINTGVRVRVSFGQKRVIGYVVGLSNQTRVKNLKKVLDVLDDFPVLDKSMLGLTREVSEYYCCFWGQVIETALPEYLRRGTKLLGVIPPIEVIEEPCCRGHLNVPYSMVGALPKTESLLIQDFDKKARWDVYLEEIKEALDNKRSVIMLFTDIDSVLRAREIIKLKFSAPTAVLYRKGPVVVQDEWAKLLAGEINIAIGTRSAIFAPVKRLGLVIVDEEQDTVYKQEQVPHYNARQVALMRAAQEKAKLILAASCPSLDALYLSKKGKIKYITLPQAKALPEIKLVDIRAQYYKIRQKNIILSKYLEDQISVSLNSKEKVLLVLDRKGFATFAKCSSCGSILKCRRCNINLVYHFSEGSLNCHYCNFKIEPPKICPDCNAGYIRYSGLGTQKLESELSRIFPNARIKRFENNKPADINEADIFVATSGVIKKTEWNFDLIGVLGIDNSLNRPDLSASQKAFCLLTGLLGLTQKRMVIETGYPAHYGFSALAKKDISLFYEQELSQRRELGFSPYSNMAIVKLRGRIEERVKQASLKLFERLNSADKPKSLRIISVNPAQPAQLRGNFYWQVLVAAGGAKKISKFLKTNLKGFPHSGIIVTVDVDPV